MKINITVELTEKEKDAFMQEDKKFMQCLKINFKKARLGFIKTARKEIEEDSAELYEDSEKALCKGIDAEPDNAMDDSAINKLSKILEEMDGVMKSFISEKCSQERNKSSIPNYINRPHRKCEHDLSFIYKGDSALATCSKCGFNFKVIDESDLIITIAKFNDIIYTIRNVYGKDLSLDQEFLSRLLETEVGPGSDDILRLKALYTASRNHYIRLNATDYGDDFSIFKIFGYVPTARNVITPSEPKLDSDDMRILYNYIRIVRGE